MADAVANLARWKERVLAMPQAARDAVDAVTSQNANEFADRLRTNVPKDHGDLASTIEVTNDKPLSYTVSIGNSSFPYPAYLEFGHRDEGKHVPGHPYFFPLLRVIRKRLRGRMGREIKKAVRNLCTDGNS